MESQRAFTRERENIHVSYPLPVDHLTTIGVSTLLKWNSYYINSSESEEIPLDTLYKLTIEKDGKQ